MEDQAIEDTLDKMNTTHKLKQDGADHRIGSFVVRASALCLLAVVLSATYACCRYLLDI